MFRILRFTFLLILSAICPQYTIGQCDWCKTQEFPLHCAIETAGCTIDDVRNYVEVGYDVNAIDTQRGDTPLHRLAYMYNSKDDKSLCEYLLRQGANPSIVDSRGSNAVDEALTGNKLELVDLYLESGFVPVSKKNHPYYEARINKDLRAIKRIQKYEKNSKWNASIEVPLSFRYDGFQHKAVVAQLGLMEMEDDYLFASSSKGILLGPSFEIEDLKRVGIDLTAFYQFAIFKGALGIRHYFGEKATTFLDPQIGLAIGSYLSFGYSRRIILNKNTESINKHNFYIHLLIPHILSIDRKKRSVYYEKTRY